MTSHSILIVEDENITAMELQERLKSWNYHVAAIASNGRQAIQNASELHPDLILMDIILKGDLDGIDTAEQIQATLDIPIVYVTAYADQQTLQRAKISTPYGYVLKPFDERELQIVLEMAIYKHRTEQELRQYREHLETLVQARTLELQRAKEDAEAASYAKTAFMTNISHEFFTPLNSILGYTQLLQLLRQEKRLSNVQRSYVEVIKRSGERLLTLVRNTLDVVRMETKPIILDESSFPLVQFLADVSQQGREWARKKGLEFHEQFASDLPETIFSDRERLQQVLFAVLDNAVTFSESGCVSFRVSLVFPVSEYADEEPSHHFGTRARLRFEIEDTGPGIPDVLEEAIFRPFKQVDEYLQKRDGKVGLGLALSRRLIRRMGGDLQFKSVLGQGSLFYFELELSDGRELLRADSQTRSSNEEQVGEYIPLPEKYLLPLYELSISGDIYEIMRYLECIEELEEHYAPFLQKIQQFTASFNISRLRRFLEAYLPHDDDYERRSATTNESHGVTPGKELR